MVDFGGWQLPQQYSSIGAEHLAVRRSAGLFDLSHMGRLELSGPGTAEFLQSLLTNDLSRLSPGSAQYTLLCREDGGILDDLVAYRRAEDAFLLVVNASNRVKDLAWLSERLPGAVTLHDSTHEVALLALQGPRAESILAGLGLPFQDLPYFSFREVDLSGTRILVSRTGYTGEDGFELFLGADRAALVWRRLLDTGRDAGLLPCGLGSRDACRLEAGLRLYGNDMDETSNPFDCGLGWTVKLNKGEFVGSKALARARAAGPRRHMVGLLTGERDIPRHGARVVDREFETGVVTSGTYSFFLSRGIAMASLAVGSGEPGEVVQVAVRDRLADAEVVALPIYRGSVRSPEPGLKPGARAGN